MQFPFDKQPDAMDCGSCCLKMIASYHGRDYSLDTLREYTFAGVDGVSLHGIAKAAEKLGFKTVGGLVSFNTLISKVVLPLPALYPQHIFCIWSNRSLATCAIHKFERLCFGRRDGRYQPE